MARIDAKIDAAIYQKQARNLIALAEEDAWTAKGSPVTSEIVQIRAAAALVTAVSIYCAEHGIELESDDDAGPFDVN